MQGFDITSTYSIDAKEGKTADYSAVFSFLYYLDYFKLKL